MKNNLSIGALVVVFGTQSLLYGEFDTALAFGDAATDQGIDNMGDRENGRDSGTLTVDPENLVYEITSGGGDFWGTSDSGTFIYNANGDYTTTGDLTASVRHVGVNIDSQRSWGRGMLAMRLTQGNTVAGAPEADDAYFGSFRRSDAENQVGTQRRPGDVAQTWRGTTVGSASEDLFGDQRDHLQHVGREDEGNPVFLAVGRNGNRWWSSHAMDLDENGSPGRYVTHYALDGGQNAMGLTSYEGVFSFLEGPNEARDNVGMALGDEVTVVLGHQAHNDPKQLSGPDLENGGRRVNTATFDHFLFDNQFDSSFFGFSAGPTTWDVDGMVELDDGQIYLSAFVRDFEANEGMATGENVSWKLKAVRASEYFVPAPGSEGSHKDPNVMEPADLVPPANFRISDTSPDGSGLTADLYVNQPNAESREGNLGYIAANDPTGSLNVRRIAWDDNTKSGYYKTAQNEGGFYEATGGANFGGNEEQYGVDLHGEIFIPANGGEIDEIEALLGLEYILFEDGTDDYVYLEIDGQILLDDNDYTNSNSVLNGGGNICLMDVSDPKFDDGEWVSFRLVMWEEKFGDRCFLYWDATDTNNTFELDQTPGTFSAPVIASGIEQMGDQDGTVDSGMSLEAGDWIVILEVANTQTSRQFIIGNTVLPTMSELLVTEFSYDTEGQTVNLTWNSVGEASYAIEASTTLRSNEPVEPGDWEVISSGIASGGLSTVANDIAIPANLQGVKTFFRIVEE